MNLLFEDLENNQNFTNCGDINRSGVKRFGYAPLIGAANMYYSRKMTPGPFQFLPANSNVGEYMITACVNHSPDEWTGYVPPVKSLFSYLNERYLKDLRSGKAILMLDQSFEGNHDLWLWKFFHPECAKLEIPPQAIVYVTGNLIAEENYEKWADVRGISERIKVIGYCHFENDMAMTSLYGEKNRDLENLPTFEDQIKYKSENPDKIKTFACLNKRIRDHRVWFYMYMYDANMLGKGLVSMNSFGYHGHRFEGKTMPTDKMEGIAEILPLLVYNKPNNVLSDNFYINRFNDQICLDTWVSVISEAHCGDSAETLFISEKTFKPIACHQPFIIMGNRNSMSKMREMGYKTFDGFIDESYDTLPTHERMQAIIESLKKIDNIPNKLDWFKSMEEIIDYNYNHFMDSLKNPPEAFSELNRYYIKYFNKML